MPHSCPTRRSSDLGRGVVEPVRLRVAVRAEHQHVREVAQQSEQALAIGIAERVASGRLEQRDVHAQYQQALLRYGRQVGFEERELVFAETAGVCRLHAGPVDHVVEQHERRERFFPGEGVGTEMSRSEEHTSELQSLMRISYAVFCLKKKR